MSRLAAPGGRVEEISRPEAVPEYLWQGCKAETYGREKKLKDEIIRRVMTFRGKAMIEHESKLRIQQKALIQTTDAALKAQAETLAAELPTSLEEAGRRALSAAFCSDRGGHRSAAREKDDDVESCYHRCVQIISRAADAYAQRKKTVALESLNAEVQAMNRAAGPPLSKFSSSDTESVEPTLKQLLEAEICLALEKERKHLMIDEASSISADKRDAEDILGLIQMNLHLAAKIAVLKALDS